MTGLVYIHVGVMNDNICIDFQHKNKPRVFERKTIVTVIHVLLLDELHDLILVQYY